jgi:hypothetical protein
LGFRYVLFMGYSVKQENALGDFDILKDDEGFSQAEEFFYYWRKHHDLHGWMERLYRAKGGTKESFNCVKVRLTMEDLQQLALDVSKGHLPETTGFFFGDNPPDADSVERDMEFIGKAMAVVAVGDAVYYDSWW